MLQQLKEKQTEVSYLVFEVLISGRKMNKQNTRAKTFNDREQFTFYTFVLRASVFYFSV